MKNLYFHCRHLAAFCQSTCFQVQGEIMSLQHGRGELMICRIKMRCVWCAQEAQQLQLVPGDSIDSQPVSFIKYTKHSTKASVKVKEDWSPLCYSIINVNFFLTWSIIAGNHICAAFSYDTMKQLSHISFFGMSWVCVAFPCVTFSLKVTSCGNTACLLC